MWSFKQELGYLSNSGGTNLQLMMKHNGECFLIVTNLSFLQGLLSFLSAPLLGALSDIWGRKSFLVLTVLFTCCPIPLMLISPWLVLKVLLMQLAMKLIYIN